MTGGIRASIATIDLYGPIIASTLDTIQRQLQVKLQAGYYYLILNVSGVTMLDSLGLGFLMEVRRRCGDQGGKLVLCELSEAVKLTLNLSDTNSVLPSFPSEQDARQYLERVSSQS